MLTSNLLILWSIPIDPKPNDVRKLYCIKYHSKKLKLSSGIRMDSVLAFLLVPVFLFALNHGCVRENIILEFSMFRVRLSSLSSVERNDWLWDYLAWDLVWVFDYFYFFETISAYFSFWMQPISNLIKKFIMFWKSSLLISSTIRLDNLKCFLQKTSLWMTWSVRVPNILKWKECTIFMNSGV